MSSRSSRQQGAEVGERLKDEIARRAILAVLKGEEPKGASRVTCGRWWILIEGLQRAYAQGGIEFATTAFNTLMERVPGLDALMESEPLTPLSAEQLLAKEFAPLKWAIPEIVPEGLTILAGAPKIGKSWLCLDLALAIAGGGRALGTVPVERGNVLYLALEDSQRRLKERLDRLLGGAPIPGELEFISMDHNLPRWDHGGKPYIQVWLDGHPGTRMVIIDTFAKFKPQQQVASGVYDQDYRSVQEMLWLARKRRIALVVVHHTRKALSEDPVASISGSFGLAAGVDGTLVLKRERGRMDAVLHVIGRDVHDKELALRWDGMRRRCDGSWWARRRRCG